MLNKQSRCSASEVQGFYEMSLVRKILVNPENRLVSWQQLFLICISFFFAVSSYAAPGQEMISELKALLKNGRTPAIVLVDVDDFAVNSTMASSIYGDASRKALQKEANILEYAAKHNLPVIDIQTGATSESRTYRSLLSRAVKSSRYASYRKTEYDGFRGGYIQGESKNLSSVIQDMNVTDVFVMGYQDCQCVLETAKGAIRELPEDVHVYVHRESNIDYLQGNTIISSDNEYARLGREENGRFHLITDHGSETRCTIQ